MVRNTLPTGKGGEGERGSVSLACRGFRHFRRVCVRLVCLILVPAECTFAELDNLPLGVFYLGRR